jgi:hypothetical protein
VNAARRRNIPYPPELRPAARRATIRMRISIESRTRRPPLGGVAPGEDFAAHGPRDDVIVTEARERTRAVDEQPDLGCRRVHGEGSRGSRHPRLGGVRRGEHRARPGGRRRLTGREREQRE